MLHRRSCTDACSHGTNSSCSYCSQHTNLSVSDSERETDSGSALDSPVIVEVTELDSQQQQQHRQFASSNGPSFFGIKPRSHSINCHTLSSDPEPEHDRDHDHETSFEWWFHRRKSSHKSRYCHRSELRFTHLFVVVSILHISLWFFSTGLYYIVTRNQEIINVKIVCVFFAEGLQSPEVPGAFTSTMCVFSCVQFVAIVSHIMYMKFHHDHEKYPKFIELAFRIITNGK